MQNARETFFSILLVYVKNMQKVGLIYLQNSGAVFTRVPRDSRLSLEFDIILTLSHRWGTRSYNSSRLRGFSEDFTISRTSKLRETRHIDIVSFD